MKTIPKKPRGRSLLRGLLALSFSAFQLFSLSPVRAQTFPEATTEPVVVNTTTKVLAAPTTFWTANADAIAAAAASAFANDSLDIAHVAGLQTALDAKLAITTAASTYQPLDSDLSAIAALSTTSFGRATLSLADAAAGRSYFGVVIGTNVQAWSDNLDTFSGFTPLTLPVSTATQVELNRLPSLALRRVAQRYYDFASTGVGTVRAVVFGDSLASEKPKFLLPYIAASLGQNTSFPIGGALSGRYTSDLTPVIQSGTFDADSGDGFTYWPTGPLPKLVSGSSVKWTRDGVNPTFSSSTIYYVIEPGAGSFDVKAGGVTLATVDASNATVDVGSYEVVQSSAQALLETVHASGGGIRFIAFTDTGLETGVRSTTAASLAGLSLSDALSEPQAVSNLEAFLTAYAPDVFTFEMDDTFVPADLETLGDSLEASAPLADKIFIATSPSAAQPTQTTRRDLLAAFCAGRDQTFFFFDGWTPVSPYQSLVDRGWQNEGIHPLTAYQAAISSLLVHQVGLDSVPYAHLPKAVYFPGYPSRFGRGSSFAGPGDSMSVDTDGSFGYDWNLTVPRSLSVKTRGAYGTGTTDVVRFSGNPGSVSNILPDSWFWGAEGAASSLSVTTSDGYPKRAFRNTATASGGDEIEMGVLHLRYCTLATLPSANNRTLSVITVADGGPAGEPCFAYSIGGASWIRFTDGQAVGATPGYSFSGTNTGDQTATTVANTSAGNIAATNVQAAINELDSEKATAAQGTKADNAGAVTGLIKSNGSATFSAAVAGTDYAKVPLTATAALDFGSIAAGASEDLTITISGAGVGYSTTYGLPAAPTAGITYNSFVSATDTFTLRATNITTGGALDPPSATYRATVFVP